MRIGITFFTSEGGLLAGSLTGSFAADWIVRKGQPLSEWTREMFRNADAILFIGAAGIAVREIAPYVKDKLTDPAVLVIDAAGHFVIPILSGHYGGGNALARALADLIGAQAVITTASDEEGTFQIDELARRSGLWITSHEKLVRLAAKAVRGEKIRIFSELPVEDTGDDSATDAEWQAGVTAKYGTNADAGQMAVTATRTEETPDQPTGKNNEVSSRRKTDKAVIITAEGRTVTWEWSDTSPKKDRESADAVILDSAMGLDPDVIENPFQPLYLYPRHITIGIGCIRGLAPEALKARYDAFLKAHQIDSREVACIATIDKKESESAIVQLAEDYQLRLRAYSAGELQEAAGTFTGSQFVERTVGVDNVCERAAVLAACEIRRRPDEGRICIHKEAANGVTLAAAKCPDTILL